MTNPDRSPLTHIPTAGEMYIGRERRKLKMLRMWARYWLRRPFYAGQARRLIAWLNAHPEWLPLFHENPVRMHAVIYRYLDKRFSPRERVDHIIETFEALARILGPERVDTLVRDGTIEITRLTDTLTLNLNLNVIDFLEGYFSVNFQDGTDKHYYNASFGMVDGRMLIASLQGPKGDDAQELVKKLTKELHGYRPMFLLVDALKMTAALWGLDLLGIPYKDQVKIRLHGSKKVFFNYDESWQENGGEREGAYWRLPTTVERRPLEDIQSKKRSMYRRRYEMLDRLTADMKERIG